MEKLYIVSYYHDKVVGIKGVEEGVPRAKVEEVYDSINKINKILTERDGTRTCQHRIISVKSPEIQAMLDFMLLKLNYIDMTVRFIREKYDELYGFDGEFYKTYLNTSK